MSLSAPTFAEKKPEPILCERLYNGRKMTVISCKVRVDKVKGWVENPRINVLKRQMQEKVGQRELTQDEIFEIMKESDEIKLSDLRDDILKNGLREPLTLSFDGELLDGNRRFFALKYALEEAPKDYPNRQELETVPAYVLLDTASDEDKHNVLVEENFSASLKIEWPDYVKAEMVLQASKDGLSPKDISAKFGWPMQKVRTALRIGEITDDFLVYATSEKDPEDPDNSGLGLSDIEAERVCAKNYQFFNEAQKSFYAPLKTDAAFKVQFFKWIADGKFASFPEVRIAHKAWEDPEIRDVIMGPEPSAAKKAKALLDCRQYDTSSGDVNDRISKFVTFLQKLEAEQIATISESSRHELTEALNLIIKYAAANKK